MISGAPKGVIFHIEGFGVAVHLGTAPEGWVVISDSAPGNSNPATVLWGESHRWMSESCMAGFCLESCSKQINHEAPFVQETDSKTFISFGFVF